MEKDFKIIAGTGHRPPKLGGYSNKVKYNLAGLAVMALKEYKPDIVISGMALGWDTALALAATTLEIPLIAAVPFEGQELKWPLEGQVIYKNLLSKAKEIVIVSPGGYSPKAMQVRNEYMVDKCTLLLALWDGSAGGTGNCLRYAKIVKKPFINLWTKYSEIL